MLQVITTGAVEAWEQPLVFVPPGGLDIDATIYFVQVHGCGTYTSARRILIIEDRHRGGNYEIKRSLVRSLVRITTKPLGVHSHLLTQFAVTVNVV